MFDEQVVRLDTRIRGLLEQFVCVRLVKANGLDLNAFQFDFDLTFVAFFMNVDGTIYGRFGSRSDPKDASKDISMEGFHKALAGAMALHTAYPANKEILARKSGGPAQFSRPEDYPSLRGKYKDRLSYEGNVSASCIHCHMVRDAERLLWRDQHTAFSDEITFPWPMPDVLGLQMDPQEAAQIAAVQPNTVAAAGGFKTGDRILTLDQQPILSTADIQWILEHKKEGDRLDFLIERGNEKKELNVKLEPRWRRGGDIGWRATTWDLRRMVFGGLVLKDLSNAERLERGMPSNRMGLVVDYVGQYGEHAAGKKAGIQKDDVIVQIADTRERMSEAQALAYLLRTTTKGETTSMEVLRRGRPLKFSLPMQ